MEINQVTINQDMLRAILYIRVSSQDQTLGFSLDNQKEACLAALQRDGYQYLKVFADKGLSAKTIDARPQLLELLKFVKNPKNNCHAVYFYHSSRLSRNTKDWLDLRLFFSKLGIKLVSVSEPMITGNDPVQTFISTILGANNQLDNDLRSQNVKNGMYRRFKSGLSPCKPPLGYLKSGERHTPAQPDPVWFPILQTMWRRIDEEKLTLGSVVNELNKLKLKKFNKQSVQNMFKDSFYYGVIRSETYKEEIVGKHTPMIDENRFYRVRQIISGKSPYKGEHKRLRDDFMLKEILLCDICTRHLTACYSTGRISKHPYYLCSSRKHKPKSYKRDDTETLFLNMLADIKPLPEYLKYYTELIREKYHNRYELANKAHDQLQKEISELDALLKTIREKNARGIYTDREYIEMKDELQAERITKQAALSERQVELVELDELINFMIYYLSNLDKVFQKASPEGRVKIAGSILPLKLKISDLNNRTATLGRQYYQIATSRAPRQFKYPVPDSNRRFLG